MLKKNMLKRFTKAELEYELRNRDYPARLSEALEGAREKMIENITAPSCNSYFDKAKRLALKKLFR